MMDSMTDEELDRKKKIDEFRMKRIARGCGCLPIEVEAMLDEYNKFAKMVEKMGSLTKGKGDLKDLTRNPNNIASKLGSMVPQNILNQMGGTGNLMNMMKEMGSLEGMGQMIGGKKKGKR
jgi:signal recognition particle subunit SRP54